MNNDPQPANLEQLLDKLDRATRGRDKVELGMLLEVVGRKSFAPLLLVAGLIALSPLSGIPGVPTLVAVMVLLIAMQLLLRRKHFWLPRWLLKRKVSRVRLEQVLKFLRGPARFIDRFLRRRMTLVTQEAGLYITAVLCVVIAVTMPPMEIVPFAATSAGAALTVLALSFIAQDGLLALIALAITSATALLVLKGLLT